MFHSTRTENSFEIVQVSFVQIFENPNLDLCNLKPVQIASSGRLIQGCGQWLTSMCGNFLWFVLPWWHHQMETFSLLLALSAGNSPVVSPHKGPVTQSLDVFFDLHLNKRLNKQSSRRWFEMPLRSLWRHYNAEMTTNVIRKLEMGISRYILWFLCISDFMKI